MDDNVKDILADYMSWFYDDGLIIEWYRLGKSNVVFKTVDEYGRYPETHTVSLFSLLAFVHSKTKEAK